MDAIQKFLRKLAKKERETVTSLLNAIVRNEIENLDISSIKGRKGWFRCRKGNIRIIFIRVQLGVNVVYEVQWRGKAYRKI